MLILLFQKTTVRTEQVTWGKKRSMEREENTIIYRVTEQFFAQRVIEATKWGIVVNLSEQLLGSWLDFYFNMILYQNRGKKPLERLSATYWAKRGAAVITYSASRRLCLSRNFSGTLQCRLRLLNLDQNLQRILNSLKSICGLQISTLLGDYKDEVI